MLGRRKNAVRASGGDQSPAPFIVGVGRSGTTLLRLMLDAHPELAIPPETHFAVRLVKRFEEGRLDAAEAAEWISSKNRWGDFGLDATELESRLAAHRHLAAGDALRDFFTLYAERHDKSRWGDKTPIYVRQMRRLERAVPEAHFVHMIRDGRDVALSVWDRVGKEKDAVKMARLWKRRIRKARRQAEKLGHYFEVRYEDLILDTEPTLRRVADFIKLDWDAAMLRYHEQSAERMAEMDRALPALASGRERPGERRLEAFKLTSEPPQKGRVERWRKQMDPADVQAFEDTAGDLLEELGYETGDCRAS
ncbi:MAG TPA: sulfotransferase [Solirubrobacterales bacterium]|nr:sulfotransferase [Solirubrobacterales bacterium]